MNLINKFKNIEIQVTNAIPEADMDFCRKHFAFYSKVFKTYEKHLTTMLELEKEQETLKTDVYDSVYYIVEYKGVSSVNIIENMISSTKFFINKICSYFEKKYNIKIDENSLPQASNNYEREQRFCELDELLKSIIDNLDGFSFFEKAVEQIKEKSKTKRFYREWQEKPNYDVKGKTIKFRVPISDIRPSLYFYDNEEKEIIDYYTNNKILQVKHFDNGNTDIYFKSSEYALDYARKYLGYEE